MLHYQSYGNPDAPAVVLLHGFLGAAADWEPTAEALAEQYYALAFDAPGHGRSVGLPAAAYGFAGFSALLSEQLRRLGVGRYALVGYSMGGRLALHHALAGGGCRALLAESCAPGYEDAAEAAARARADERLAQQLEAQGAAAFVDAWYRQPLFAGLAADPERLEALLARRRRGDAAELARALRGFSTGVQPCLWAALDAPPFPVLAVAGALDGKYAEIAQRMAARSDRIRAAVLPNCGHNVHAEQPEPFARLLLDFLNLNL